MREARKATDTELYQLIMLIEEEFGLDVATTSVEHATFIAVFDDYKEDWRSSPKKVMLVIWDGAGHQCELFGWTEGPMYQVKSKN
jgi:hypothetical protein